MNEFSLQFFSYMTFEWKWVTLEGRAQSDPKIYSFKEINRPISIFSLSIRVMVKNGNLWSEFDPRKLDEICWKQYGF